MVKILSNEDYKKLKVKPTDDSVARASKTKLVKEKAKVKDLQERIKVINETNSAVQAKMDKENKDSLEVKDRAYSKLNPKSNAVLYDGRTLLYENYKEPLKSIEKEKGYGYYGTVAMTEDREFLQCHICGNLFANVGMHLRLHKVTAEKYKETYQLSMGTALINEEGRRRLQKQSVKKFDGKLPEHLIEYNRKVQSGEIKHPGSKHRGMSLERRNEEGLCPDQLLEKIKELATKLGHTPSYDEFKRHYEYHFIGAITFVHGSYLNAVKKAKLVSAKELKEPSNERLLQDLVDFKERFGRIPMKSDFARGFLRSRGIYNRRFGTMNNARIEAGLNAVIPMPFGQIVEMTPDEYIEYKATGKTRKKIKI